MKLKDILKEAIAEISYKKSGLENPNLADLDKNKEISSWEKKRGGAIEKNLEEYNPQDDENNIRFGMEVRPLQTMPSLDNGEIEAMNSDMCCKECGAPMMYEDRMCEECGCMQDAGQEEPHQTEPDHEVFMAKASLQSIVSNASELMSKLGDEEIDIPAWVQDHITNAANYINQANEGYYEYETGEGNETPDEDALYEAKGVDKLGYTKNGQAAGPFRGAQGPMQMASGNLEEKKKPSAGLDKKQKSAIVKKAEKGGDVGKKGKSFEKVAQDAGGGEKGKKIAAAAMWKGAAKRAHK